MRVLAFSDIHRNLTAVERVRSRLPNDFDLIIVAGDVGPFAEGIFKILDTFECPIAYVLGNWDCERPYDQRLGAKSFHLHGSPLILDPVRLLGFSGCQSHWGRNPIALRLQAEFDARNASFIEAQKEAETAGPLALERLRRTKAFKAYDAEAHSLGKQIEDKNRSQVAAEMQMGGNGLFTIVVTHARLYRTQSDMPDADLFIFGHRHTFANTIHRGARFLNVAALDIPVTVVPRGGGRAWGDFNANAGNFVIFDIRGAGVENIRLHRFGWDRERWQEVPNHLLVGAPYLEDDPSLDTVELA